MEPPKTVLELVERFDLHLGVYKLRRYARTARLPVSILTGFQTPFTQWMLDLHKRLQTAKTEYKRTALQRQIAATDEKIAIVEESVKK